MSFVSTLHKKNVFPHENSKQMQDGISLESDYQELQKNYKQVQTETHDLKKQLDLSLQTV